ncbi:hypothetical protein VTK26DRAFT_6467 [Humicola hyalothermophila]
MMAHSLLFLDMMPVPAVTEPRYETLVVSLASETRSEGSIAAEGSRQGKRKEGSSCNYTRTKKKGFSTGNRFQRLFVVNGHRKCLAFGLVKWSEIVVALRIWKKSFVRYISIFLFSSVYSNMTQRNTSAAPARRFISVLLGVRIGGLLLAGSGHDRLLHHHTIPLPRALLVRLDVLAVV